MKYLHYPGYIQFEIFIFEKGVQSLVILPCY